MLPIHIVSVLFLVMIYFFIYRMDKKPTYDPRKIFLILLAGAFLLRCILAGSSEGFASDTACFAGWANLAFEGGIKNFYASGVFADYPPGFVYVLYFIGAIFSLFKIPYLSAPCLLLLKLPAIFCDMATALLFYRIASKKLPPQQVVMLTGLYLLNPAIILNSSIWGQVDSVFTLTVLLMCWFLTENQMTPAYIVFGIGVLLKPQTLVFAPVLIYGIIDRVILFDFSWRNFFHNLFAGLTVICFMVLACMPFGLDLVFLQYASTLGSYPYVAVNAFNLWGFFGLNWISQETRLLFFSYRTWGTIILLLIVLLSAMLFFRAQNKESRYFTTASFLIISVFLFSIRMHERYLYPALALILFAYAVRPLKEFLEGYFGFTIIHLYNTAYILYFYDPSNYDRKAPLILTISACMVICGFSYYYTLVRYDIRQVSDRESTFTFLLPFQIKWRRKKTAPRHFTYEPAPSEEKLPFLTQDAIILFTIMAMYSLVAFWDLGSLKAPQSDALLRQGDTVVVYTGEDQAASYLYWYLGNYENRWFTLEYKTVESDVWRPVGADGQIIMTSVFAWDRTQLPENCHYLRLTCNSDMASVMELALADANGVSFMPLNAPDYQKLFDENDTFPADGISFRNSTYFDEIYHARTAYEFLHGLTTYETTHPPLGKIIMSVGVFLFGMNPFGWRFMGTLLGVLMLPVIYLLARNISQDRLTAGFASVLFAFDFMHFAQTRLATIDVFVTFFILLMYYFMYRYSRLSFYDTPLHKTFVPLGACGIAMGLGIACKWTGIYAGIGLAVIFFLTLYRRYREYRLALKKPSGGPNGLLYSKVIATFRGSTIKTILFCMVFFVLVPGLIYLLSYIPFVGRETQLWAKMIANQEYMFRYHANLDAPHYYSSHWYEWPTMIRPIFYYSGIISDTTREGISAFGNPLVWWVGIPAFAYMLYLVIKQKDRIALFLCIAYLAQYLPWMFVDRCTFIYHYFPSVPFVVLMIMYSALTVKDMFSEKKYYIALGLYAAASLALFALFYPVLSGHTVSIQYVDTFLRWMKSWVLILNN